MTDMTPYRYDATVIGGGLFGSIIAKRLTEMGLDTLTVDAAHEDAGSRPAACLMKPGWYSGLGKDVTQPALALLDRLYGVNTIAFRANGIPTDVQWCDPNRILKRHNRFLKRHKVKQIAFLQGNYVLTPDNPKNPPIHTRRVIVAAGIWTPELVPVDGGLTGQMGLALLWPDTADTDARIQVWAPYKQLVYFDRGDGLWTGDGSAILPANWTAEREAQSIKRCSDFAGLPALTATKLRGIRPYSKMKPCYLKEVTPNVWVATGGAKNGTIAAAWCAHIIGESINANR